MYGGKIMAKGAEAKLHVIEKIAAAFGTDYIGEFDKKIYVWSTEGGEKMQVAIAMTCPKVPVGIVNQSNELNFENNMNNAVRPTSFEPAEFTDNERKTVEELMKQLGL